jgi:hypothetical protein
MKKNQQFLQINHVGEGRGTIKYHVFAALLLRYIVRLANWLFPCGVGCSQGWDPSIDQHGVHQLVGVHVVVWTFARCCLSLACLHTLSQWVRDQDTRPVYWLAREEDASSGKCKKQLFVVAYLLQAWHRSAQFQKQVVAFWQVCWTSTQEKLTLAAAIRLRRGTTLFLHKFPVLPLYDPI